MNPTDRKKHWDAVFQNKDTTQVSWYQPQPDTSLKLIKDLNLDPDDHILEVGSGDSFLGDHLLQSGYSHISLLDVSEVALDILKKRLHPGQAKLEYRQADITDFCVKDEYMLWHDRAVFHFLTDPKDIEAYISNCKKSIKTGGYLIIGAFSVDGPDMCSNLPTSQYSKESIKDLFSKGFRLIKQFDENHITPSGSAQNFLFTVFQKL